MKTKLFLLLALLAFSIILFSQDNQAVNKTDVLSTLIQLWYIIIPSLLVIIEGIVRLTPTEKDNSILNNILKWVNLINSVVPNKSKSGGVFKLKSDIIKK